jgi:uncharacterized protein YdeI (YjbR/CyaY-like superfamily)
MGSKDPRIDAYITAAAPFARPVLRHLRTLVHQGCPDVEETIRWSMPSFTSGGRILCGMAAFKAHCTFGFWHAGMQARLAAAGSVMEEAMGHLGRITGLKDLPSDETLLGHIRAAVELNAEDLPARPRPAPKKHAPAEAPADLATGLRANAAAAKSFKDLPPGQRREYVEWITSAKREETRSRRLQTAIEWLSEGKRLNWKYENC